MVNRMTEPWPTHASYDIPLADGRFEHGIYRDGKWTKWVDDKFMSPMPVNTED